MAESNVERARRGFRAALDGDFETIGELLDPDVKWHGGDPSADGACRNRNDVITFMQKALERIQGVELVDVVDAGDKVVVILGPARVANVTTFRDGKVVEMVHYPDVDDALTAARAG